MVFFRHGAISQTYQRFFIRAGARLPVHSSQAHHGVKEPQEAQALIGSLVFPYFLMSAIVHERHTWRHSDRWQLSKVARQDDRHAAKWFFRQLPVSPRYSPLQQTRMYLSQDDPAHHGDLIDYQELECAQVFLEHLEVLACQWLQLATSFVHLCKPKQVSKSPGATANVVRGDSRVSRDGKLLKPTNLKLPEYGFQAGRLASASGTQQNCTEMASRLTARPRLLLSGRRCSSSRLPPGVPVYGHVCERPLRRIQCIERRRGLFRRPWSLCSYQLTERPFRQTTLSLWQRPEQSLVAFANDIEPFRFCQNRHGADTLLARPYRIPLGLRHGVWAIQSGFVHRRAHLLLRHTATTHGVFVSRAANVSLLPAQIILHVLIFCCLRVGPRNNDFLSPLTIFRRRMLARS